MKCPLCSSTRSRQTTAYVRDYKTYEPLCICKKCGLHYLTSLHKNRNAIYGKNYSVWGKDEKSKEKEVEISKKIHFRYLLSKLDKVESIREKTVLDIGTGKGYLLEVAKEMGAKSCYGLELSTYSATIANKKFPGNIFQCEVGKLKTNKKFDIITMTDILEHLPHIKDDFKVLDSVLKKGGYLLITTPNTQSLTKKFGGKKWFQYKYEHVIYFNKKSMRFLLSHYDIIKIGHNTKILKGIYYRSYIKKYSSPFMQKIFPRFLDNVSIRNPMVGELLVIARK